MLGLPFFHFAQPGHHSSLIIHCDHGDLLLHQVPVPLLDSHVHRVEGGVLMHILDGLKENFGVVGRWREVILNIDMY